MRKSLLMLALLALGLVLLTGCKKTHFGNAPIDAMGQLQVSFTDPAWTGDKVPSGMQCRQFGGKQAMSPALRVAAIPAGADQIIVEFNDKSYAQLANNGGHGTIGVAVPQGATEVVVPAVPGETNQIPDGVIKIAGHRATSSKVGKGAYLPPCSGGQGHAYFALVHAVNTTDKTVLAQGYIALGRY